MSAFSTERVTSVHHWTDTLFSFTTTRDAGLRFVNGQFAMIGLLVEGRPLLRAYSMVSANYEDQLEFLSIKVQEGPLTSRLQHIEVGSDLLVGRKPTGTLIHANLHPGRTLYLLGTGTGLAPFMCLIKDPETYERFDRVVLAHGCRSVDELAYVRFITEELPESEFLGEMVREKLLYYPAVTRDSFRNQGRLTDLLYTGKMPDDLGLPRPDPNLDRFMMCGSPAMLADMGKWLTENGYREGNHTEPGEFVVERAFVEK
jgi:ferredoxin--NADP+ reductase